MRIEQVWETRMRKLFREWQALRAKYDEVGEAMECLARTFAEFDKEPTTGGEAPVDVRRPILAVAQLVTEIEECVPLERSMRHALRALTGIEYDKALPHVLEAEDMRSMLSELAVGGAAELGGESS